MNATTAPFSFMRGEVAKALYGTSDPAPWRLLGFTAPPASLAAVRERYLPIVRALHPDKANSAASAAFRRAATAYAALQAELRE